MKIARIKKCYLYEMVLILTFIHILYSLDHSKQVFMGKLTKITMQKQIDNLNSRNIILIKGLETEVSI